VIADPLLSLENKRVKVVLDGRVLRGRLVSIRDDFVCIEPARGRRIHLNKFEITRIDEDRKEG